MAVRYDVPLSETAKAPRTRRAYADRPGDAAPRPLKGDDAHPYLQVTNRLHPVVAAALDREAAIKRETAKLVARWGASFAGIVSWALRERFRPRRGVDNARRRG